MNDDRQHGFVRGLASFALGLATMAAIQKGCHDGRRVHDAMYGVPAVKTGTR